MGPLEADEQASIVDALGPVRFFLPKRSSASITSPSSCPCSVRRYSTRGGISVALGFLTPLGAAGIFGAMFMAMFKSHWKNGFWLQKGGYEYTLVLLVASMAIGLIGPGSYALDTLFGIALPEALLFGVLAVAALLVDVIGILINRPAETVSSKA